VVQGAVVNEEKKEKKGIEDEEEDEEEVTLVVVLDLIATMSGIMTAPASPSTALRRVSSKSLNYGFRAAIMQYRIPKHAIFKYRHAHRRQQRTRQHLDRRPWRQPCPAATGTRCRPRS
jgi:hypothetical protein